MLRVAVTVSKKATSSNQSPRRFLTLFTASLGLVEKGNKNYNKKKKKNLQVSTDKPRLLPSSHSTKEDSEGEQMDSLSVYTVFHLAEHGSTYHLCR